MAGRRICRQVHCRTAVGSNDLPSNIARIIRRQECHYIGDVLRLTKERRQGLISVHIDELGWCSGKKRWRFYHRWGYRIAPNALQTKAGRNLLDQKIPRRLGGALSNTEELRVG